MVQLGASPLNRSPAAGDEFLVEFFAIGERLIGRIDNQRVPFVMDDRLTQHGNVDLQNPHLIRDVELINLDGLSEAEAFAIAGVGPQPITAAVAPGRLTASGTPAKSEPNDLIKLRPLTPESPPGRLRGFTVSDSGEKTPLDLGELEGLSDIIQIRTTVDGSNLQVFALRENGKVVAHNLPESWAHHTDRFNRAAVPIRHLGYNCLSLHHLVVIDRDGVPWPMLPGHPGQSNFPDPGEPVLDVRTTEEHSVMLTRSGQAVLWGGNYSRSADPWPMPPESFLRNVAGICAFPEALFLLRPDGNVVAWGAGGEFPLPEVFRSSRMVSIAVNGIRLLGLDRDGQVWLTNVIEGNEEPGLANDGEPVAENISTLKEQPLTEPSVQDREGRWLAVEGQETVEFEEIRSQLAELDGIPGDAFVSGGHRLAESRFLLWIEPVEEGE